MTNPGAVWYDTSGFRDGQFSIYGEMSERLKEPVLKTGGAQVPVGSNPTLSANSLSVFYNHMMYAEVPKRPKGLPC